MTTENSEQELIRLEKLKKLRIQGEAYPNDAKITALTRDILAAEVSETPEAAKRFTVAGRVVQKRLMGKASFMHILDRAGKLQGYFKSDIIGAESFAVLQDLDIGDIIEATGYAFVTKTGEKSLHVDSFRLLVKSLKPLPEKWHGLQDVESRYRQRYLDLISNLETREIFRTRAKVISYLRKFLDDRDYLEVETPILSYTVGGATARPFLTHYNALDADMSLRIATELPLKKLVVGGFERVYEIGRIFRNEGISKKHNPEFTSLEFYQAYATFEDLMTMTQEVLVGLVKELYGAETFRFGEETIQLNGNWPRISMLDSIHDIGGVSREINLNTLDGVLEAAKRHEVEPKEATDWGRTLENLWEELVESKLIQPTFITHHPFSISPLARKNSKNPNVTDRFELFIAGMEVANAFSELNDPIDQRERFEEQMRRKEAGDHEASDIDHDFLAALEHGMPPTAGEGIGIDRLVLLLTNSTTLREVVLFPQLKRD